MTVGIFPALLVRRVQMTSLESQWLNQGDLLHYFLANILVPEVFSLTFSFSKEIKRASLSCSISYFRMRPDVNS